MHSHSEREKRPNAVYTNALKVAVVQITPFFTRLPFMGNPLVSVCHILLSDGIKQMQKHTTQKIQKLSEQLLNIQHIYSSGTALYLELVLKYLTASFL